MALRWASQVSRGCVAVVVALAALGNNPEFRASDSGAGQPEGPVSRAMERAAAYAHEALEWTCEESVRVARYDGDGEAIRESEKRFAVLLTPRESRRDFDESRSEIASRSRSARRPACLRGFPPTTSWLRLLHPEERGFILIEDLGDDTADAVRPRRRLGFRGAIPFTAGEDFREWEGTAWIDPTSGDLLAIEATPSSQAPRIAHALEQRHRFGFDFVIFNVLTFHVGPVAQGRRVEISFGDQTGFWLPRTARMETFEVTSVTRIEPRELVVVRFGPCRRFEVQASPGARE